MTLIPQTHPIPNGYMGCVWGQCLLGSVVLGGGMFGAWVHRKLEQLFGDLCFQYIHFDEDPTHD